MSSPPRACDDGHPDSPHPPLTVYGDLDVSVIDELPPCRKPVQTLLRYEENRFATYQGIGRQLRLGRQIYIVYPLIKENEKLDLEIA